MDILALIHQWLNTLTLPGLAAGVWGFARWYSKKEEEAREAFAGLVASVDNLKQNHLTHLQESLDGIKTAQVDMSKQLVESSREIVAAQNASKDAIVAAIISTRN